MLRFQRNKRAARSAAAAALVLLVLLTAAGCGVPHYPASVNMASMSMDGHNHAGHEQVGTTANTIACTELQDPDTGAEVREFELTAQDTTIRLEDGTTVEAWTFNGSTPGPELRVHEGDRVVVKLINRDIEEGVTIHWHGVAVPCSQDGVAGVTQDAVWPGESFTYSFIADHHGTYWYHSHQESSEQAKKGLIGRIVIEPKEKTFQYDKDFAVTMQELDGAGYMINGSTDGLKLNAEPGETVRLRLVNSTNRTQFMGVAGVPFKVISMDGQDLNGPTPITRQFLPVGAAQRYDLLFEMPQEGNVVVFNKYEDGLTAILGGGDTKVDDGRLYKTAPIFDFTSYGTPNDDGVTPDMAFDRTYELDFGTTFSGFTINGKAFHDVPPLLVKEGEWIKLRLIYNSGGDHPVHLHGHFFKVLTKNGKPLTGSPVYLDTILLERGDVYEIAFRADNPGLWMQHCHNLDHAAKGMSMMVNYEGVSTPYFVGTDTGNLPD
ncbi:multicopper oxidase family protein [Paenibacillus alkalitolerans]|uniref:multicopper oxidase family protein n=1 Tax=Paenibacillus alkalitolerans TaxID=2799335 RepID=UPI0018F40CC5|nr:multicopper oxidase family protein [Paenibacillus alkalitolerans]